MRGFCSLARYDQTAIYFMSNKVLENFDIYRLNLCCHILKSTQKITVNTFVDILSQFPMSAQQETEITCIHHVFPGPNLINHSFIKQQLTGTLERVTSKAAQLIVSSKNKLKAHHKPRYENKHQINSLVTFEIELELDLFHRI